MLLLVALSACLDNFAVAAAMGMSGVDRSLRLRVGTVFGIFEGGMPVVGLVLGRAVAGSFARTAPLLGGVLLGLTGAYTVVHELFAWKKGEKDGGCASKPIEGQPVADEQAPRPDAGRPELTGGPVRRPGTVRLLATGASVGIDEMVIGFALGTHHVGIVPALITFTTVSVVVSQIGLGLGRRMGARLGERGEILGGIVLVGVGVALGTGLL